MESLEMDFNDFRDDVDRNPERCIQAPLLPEQFPVLRTLHIQLSGGNRYQEDDEDEDDDSL